MAAETVYAFMDDGNDTLHVFDDSGTCRYYLDGGDGDDDIEVQGHTDVTIEGGIGNDTLEGGSGGPVGGTWSDGTPRGNIDLRGGPGFNHLSIGGGHLADVDPNTRIAIDGGGLSDLTVDNSADRLGSDYYFYDDPNSNQWTLTVVTKSANGPVTHVITYVQIFLVLQAGDGNDNFYGMFSPEAQVFGNGGDDTWDVDYQNPGNLGVTINENVEFYGGTGTDRITMDDSNNPAGRFIKLFANYSGGPSSYMNWTFGDQTTEIAVQSIEDLHIKESQHNTIHVDSWADGPVTLEAQYVEFNASNYVFGGTVVHVVNTPGIGLIDGSPVAGETGMGVDEHGPYIGQPTSYITNPDGSKTAIVNKMRIDADATATQYQFFGPLMYVEQSVMNYPAPLNLQFSGVEFTPGELNTIRITPPDPKVDPEEANANYNYQITKDALTIGSMTLSASGLQEYDLTGGGGDDKITIDSLPAGVDAEIDGGGGDNTLIVDDSQDTSAPIGRSIPTMSRSPANSMSI